MGALDLGTVVIMFCLLGGWVGAFIGWRRWLGSAWRDGGYPLEHRGALDSRVFAFFSFFFSWRRGGAPDWGVTLYRMHGLFGCLQQQHIRSS